MHHIFIILGELTVICVAQSPVVSQLGSQQGIARPQLSQVPTVTGQSDPNLVLRSVTAEIAADITSDIIQWRKWLVKVVPITIAFFSAPLCCVFDA
jgi:hypothetical protein